MQVVCAVEVVLPGHQVRHHPQAGSLMSWAASKAVAQAVHLPPVDQGEEASQEAPPPDVRLAVSVARPETSRDCGA
jgi:hypothetical protein